MIIRRWLVTLAATVLSGSAGAQTVAPQPAGPQPGGRCIVQFEGSSGERTTRINSNKLPSGKFDVYIGGGFLGRCQGQDVTLRSDSAEYYGDQNLLYLIDNVHYIEPRATVDAQRMTYWTAEAHLRAEGNVYAVLPSGTTMRGPVADYYRAAPLIRSEAMLVATGQPRLSLVQRDSVTGRPSDTVRVVAQRITTIADSLVYAGGDVHITRPDLLATGDSAFVDQGAGRARLMLKPSVEARQSRPFTLTGGIIDVFSQNKLVNRVVASPNGHATSQDLQLLADSVDLRVRNNALERAMAWGKTRAHALSPDRDIVADSIDAILPGQHVREIHAIGGAYVTSVPDTAVVHTAERDWIQGDTLVATFDSVARADTAHTPPIKSIVARYGARAMYHVKGNDRARSRPGVNYVVGRIIDIAFQDRAVQTVTVTDRASGLFLEPVDSASAARSGSPIGSPTGTPRRRSAPRIPAPRSGGVR